MLVRYLSFNLRLLLWAALPLTPILLLVNGLSSNVLVSEDVVDVSRATLSAAGCDTVYSGLQAPSPTHLHTHHATLTPARPRTPTRTPTHAPVHLV